MGLCSLWNAFVPGIFKGNDKEKFIKDLKIPEDHTPCHAIVIGYPKSKVLNFPERKNNYFDFIK